MTEKEYKSIEEIDKEIEFHKEGQSNSQYKGKMNKKHAERIKKLLQLRKKMENKK